MVERSSTKDAINSGEYKWGVSRYYQSSDNQYKIIDNETYKHPPDIYYRLANSIFNIHIPKEEIVLFLLKYGGIIKPSTPVQIQPY